MVRMIAKTLALCLVLGTLSSIAPVPASAYGAYQYHRHWVHRHWRHRHHYHYHHRHHGPVIKIRL